MKDIVLKVLILGGTHFLGPHLVQELQQQGHRVTLFNRGSNNKEWTDVETLQGDREGNLELLKNRSWDAIIDTSGHLPRVVNKSSSVLVQSTKHYIFISTIGVYRDFTVAHIDEGYPLAQMENSEDEVISDKNYGALKAECEKIIQEFFPNNHLIIRPGLIVGPLDPTERFSYWPARLNEGGEVLAPGSAHSPLQFIDVRDLAQWIVSMVERCAKGVYNATGPATPLNFEKFLFACEQAIGKKATWTWVDDYFLMEHNIQDWTEIPLWLSPERKMPYFLQVSNHKAIAAGLTFRPLSETVKAILNETKSLNKDKKSGFLDRKKEKILLELWKNKSTAIL